MSGEAEPGADPSSIERLRAEGHVIEGSGTWADVELLPAAAEGPTINEALQQMRDEERW